MKKGFGFMVILFALAPLLFSYEYIMNDGTSYGTAYVSTKITSLTGGNWDEGYYDLVLPSTHYFYFYGKKVTHVRIWTNGYVTFGFGSAPTDYNDYTPDPLPNTDNPNGYAAPWWDDWDLTSQGEIWYHLGTQSGYYWLAIEWRNVPHHDDPSSSYDFQILIYGSTYPGTDGYFNDIRFNYIDVDSGNGTHDYGKTGTIGIEHYSGAQGELYGHYQSVLTNSTDILFTPFIPVYDMTDYNSDDKPDVVVYRPTTGLWYIRANDGSYSANLPWGTKGDIPLPGDYDGGGYIDYCVFRPSTSTWWFQDVTPNAITWGTHGDIPVPADYDGNGYTDLAVFRPSNGGWYIYYMPGGTKEYILWGTKGDIPLPADYDNDGKADCAVWRPSENKWYIRRSSNPTSPWGFVWGTDGDVPMPANFDTSSYSSAAIFRPSTGEWFCYHPNWGAGLLGSWGTSTDVPVPNDWNGGGITDTCVFRPTEGKWYIGTSALGYPNFYWGTLGDKPRCRRSFQIVSPPPGVEEKK